jgi:hypothetical protein
VRYDLNCYATITTRTSGHDLKTFRTVKFAPPSLSKPSRANPLATGDHTLPRLRMRGSIPPLLHTNNGTQYNCLLQKPTGRKKQNIYLSFKKMCGGMEMEFHAFLTCAPDVYE